MQFESTRFTEVYWRVQLDYLAALPCACAAAAVSIFFRRGVDRQVDNLYRLPSSEPDHHDIVCVRVVSNRWSVAKH